MYKLEPEPEFLTSRSWSRTKMDRLRNTDFYWPEPHQEDAFTLFLITGIKSLLQMIAV
jgi:hypothetical protein